MNRTTHIILHESMHKSLDALVADFIRVTSRFPSKTTVMELLAWSNNQCSDPALPDGQTHECIKRRKKMKVVVNRCFGGYGLSDAALLELYKRGSKAVEATEPKEFYGGREGWEEQFEKGKNQDSKSFSICVAPDGKILHYTRDDKIRNDPDLVAVVEGMGEAANDWAADLEVVEIPDGIEWGIHEYDGLEHVEEAHETW